MLMPVLEVVRSSEGLVPNGNHSIIQNNWHSEHHDLLMNMLEEVECKSSDVKHAERVLNLIADAYGLFLKCAENPTWKKLSTEERKKHIDKLKNTTQVPQRTKAWYEQFSKVLTASEFSGIFANGKRRRDLIFSKVNVRQDDFNSFRLACPTDELTPTGWGIRFESVVKQILEHTYKCKIYEPGRIVHPTRSNLAASADGIIEDGEHKQQIGRLVEIKCPYSRSIGGEIPLDYWVQMQIQMEVTDIDECEYVETEIISRKPNQEGPVDLSGTELQGVVYLLKQTVADGQPFEYRYLYGTVQSTTVPELPEGFEIHETIPWGLKSFHRIIVHRDRAWFAATVAIQDSFWSDVEAARRGEIEITKSPSLTPCLIIDSE